MTIEQTSEQRTRIEEFQRKHRIALLTMLFTDVVGSTRLKQLLGERAAIELIQRHHALLREILPQFRDAEEISTAGDSFFMVFAKPSDAVQFALLTQRAVRDLARETGQPVLDRIGIHVGEIFIQERGSERRDLFGIQVDAAARIMSLGNADQILLSRFAFDNARLVLRGYEMPGIGELIWFNHGYYELKGVEEPLEVCEVGETGLAVLTPPGDSEKAHRFHAADAEPVLGWRPAAGQLVPETRWKLERPLGQGGFGEVWLAQHDTLKQRRVLKFCFKAERARALKREATLFRVLRERFGEHPNFVAIHDVFFDKAPFYLVMDYVDGPSLDRWTGAHTTLAETPLAQRLDLVAQIADALQAAHDSGIIHRDVKPSNVLIADPAGAAPCAKLVDFGIGQVVNADALAGVTRLGFTQTMLYTGSASGTPLYQAPELLAGQPATTRSDIYSLGVLLWQMIRGDFTQPLASDWAEQIDNDLLREDIHSCVAGDRSKRLAGAAELATRLRALPERHRALDEERARRVELERRAYRRGVIRTAALGACLVVAIASLAFYAFHQAGVAKVQKKRADLERAEAEAARTRAESGEKAAEAAVKRADAERRVAEAAQQELMDSYEKVGDLLKDQGQYLGVVEQRRAVLEIRTRLLGPEHPQILTGRMNLANALTDAGRGAEAEEENRAVLAIKERVLGVDHPDTLASRNSLANSLHSQRKYADAEKVQRALAADYARVLSPDHSTTILIRSNLAGTLSDQRKYAEAEEELRAVLAIQERVFGPTHSDALGTRNRLAAALEAQEKRTEAEEERRTVVAIKESHFGPEHPETVRSRMSRASALLEQGKYGEAEKELRSVLALAEKAFGPERSETLTCRNDLGVSLHRQDKYAEAEKEYHKVLEIRERTSSPEDSETLKTRNNLALALASLRKYAGVVEQRRTILAAKRQVLGPEDPEVLKKRMDLANALFDDNKLAEAEQEHRAVLAIKERVLGKDHPDTLESRNNLANALSGQHKYGDAEEVQRAVIASRERVLGPEHSETLRTRKNLAGTLGAEGKLAEEEEEHRAILVIRERLAERDPNNAELKRDLATGNELLGTVALRQEHWAAAAAAFRQEVEFARPWEAKGDADVIWKSIFAYAAGRCWEVLRDAPQGAVTLDRAQVLVDLRTARDCLRQLREENRLVPPMDKNLPWIEGLIDAAEKK